MNSWMRKADECSVPNVPNRDVDSDVCASEIVGGFRVASGRETDVRISAEKRTRRVQIWSLVDSPLSMRYILSKLTINPKRWQYLTWYQSRSPPLHTEGLGFSINPVLSGGSRTSLHHHFKNIEIANYTWGNHSKMHAVTWSLEPCRDLLEQQITNILIYLLWNPNNAPKVEEVINVERGNRQNQAGLDHISLDSDSNQSIARSRQVEY